MHGSLYLKKPRLSDLQAALNAHEKTITALVRLRAEINCRDLEGKSPLHHVRDKKKHLTHTHSLYCLQKGGYSALEIKHLSTFFIVRCFSSLIVDVCAGGIEIQ